MEFPTLINWPVHFHFKGCWVVFFIFVQILIEYLKIVSEYDQEIPQSQTADNPMGPRGRAAQPSRDTKKTN